MHVDGVLKERKTYEIMTPETIGLAGSRMVLGRHTGRHGFTDHCKKLGYKLSKDEIEQAYQKFLQVADRKKRCSTRTLWRLSMMKCVLSSIHLRLSIYGRSSRRERATAAVKIKCKGEVKEAQADGDGPVDATYNAIREATGFSPKLESYSIRAVTSGKEALGEATVKIKTRRQDVFRQRHLDGHYRGKAKAYIDAINRMVGKAGDEEPGAKAETIRKQK